MQCKVLFDKYIQVTDAVYNFIDRLAQYTRIAFPETTIKDDFIAVDNNSNSINNVEITSTDDNSNLKENTLIISERNQNVILPYTLLELQQKLNDNSNTYKSIQEIIQNCYTRPLRVYRNAPFSRFKEALNLIREREKGSLKQALDLGLELFFNSNLHPAVISACKNLDELDIYLDYLENGETNQFGYFNVVFDVAPMVIKSKRSQGF